MASRGMQGARWQRRRGRPLSAAAEGCSRPRVGWEGCPGSAVWATVCRPRPLLPAALAHSLCYLPPPACAPSHPACYPCRPPTLSCARACARSCHLDAGRGTRLAALPAPCVGGSRVGHMGCIQSHRAARPCPAIPPPPRFLVTLAPPPAYAHSWVWARCGCVCGEGGKGWGVAGQGCGRRFALGTTVVPPPSLLGNARL